MLQRIACAAIPTILLATLLACGTSKSQPPLIMVQFQPTPPTSINTGASTAIAAVVSNDTQGQGVTFSCIPVNACGTFTPSQVGSNVPTCYLAPPQVPQGNTVTVTATSISDSSKFASATITILNGAPMACP